MEGDLRKGDDVPTKDEWGEIPTDNLNIQASYKDFFGKTNEQMQDKFASCVIEMTDSLRWMPPAPFGYYIRGLADFVRGCQYDEVDASDAASCFLNLVEEKVRQQPATIAQAMEIILPVVKYLATHQADYQASPSIYGDFMEKAKIIEELWVEYCKLFAPTQN